MKKFGLLLLEKWLRTRFIRSYWHVRLVDGAVSMPPIVWLKIGAAAIAFLCLFDGFVLLMVDPQKGVEWFMAILSKEVVYIPLLLLLGLSVGAKIARRINLGPLFRFRSAKTSDQPVVVTSLKKRK